MRISDWSSDVCSSDLTAFNEVEQAAWPKFVETVPELADPAKGRQVIADIVQYAVAEGLSQEAFRAGVVNSRSEAQTSELQSLMRISDAVSCLKKKTKQTKVTKKDTRRIIQ